LRPTAIIGLTAGAATMKLPPVATPDSTHSRGVPWNVALVAQSTSR
jgi:hypothetical protein